MLAPIKSSASSASMLVDWSYIVLPLNGKSRTRLSLIAVIGCDHMWTRNSRSSVEWFQRPYDHLRSSAIICEPSLILFASFLSMFFSIKTQHSSMKVKKNSHFVPILPHLLWRVVQYTHKTNLVSLGGRPETGAIPVFHRWQEWLQLMRISIFFVLAK